MLLGAAMLAGVAAGSVRRALADAMQAMARDAEATAPTPPAIARFHAAKRDVHAMMRGLEADARARMEDAG